MKPFMNVRLESGTPIGLLRDWMRRLTAQLVQDVPEELSFCEYECRDPRCNMAKLAVCVKRTSHLDSRYLRIE